MIDTIINKALDEFVKETNIKVTFYPAKPQDPEVDGTLKFKYNNKPYQFYIEVKKELRNYQLPELEKLNAKYQPLLVIGEYIFPKIKEELRKQKIAYLETNGNVYIEEKDLLIWLDLKKAVPEGQQKKGRAFTKTGLKLVFQFLLDDELVNLTYREMAEKTGIGFGNINFIISDLKDQGFLIQLDKNTYRLTRKKELLKKWIEAYQIKLRPALLIGRFHFIDEGLFLNWKTIQLNDQQTQWGGEPAGELLTKFLKPAELTLYTTEKRMDIIKNYRLFPKEDGNVKVYQKFWPDDRNTHTVPPLLVYADLMITGDRRCFETAEKIYDEFLQNKF